MRKYIVYVCLMVYGHFANAGNFEQGIQSFEQKKYAQAKKLWQPLAEEGDIRAQYNLALIILKDEKSGVTQSRLQRQKANQYLIMSRSGGLVDSYLLKTSIDVNSTTLNSNIKPNEIISEKIDALTWLNQQQKTNYSLQLATGKSRKSMEKTQQKLLDSQLLEQPENLYIQEFKRTEQDQIIITYVLIYGTFKSYQLAKNEVEKLPDSIQKSSPWIRQFGTLQTKANGKQAKKKI